MKYKSNQKGIAQILILLLLVAGIGLGAYYVQQRTNIIPHAENNAPRTDTGSCRDNPDEAKTSVDALNNKQTGNENFYYKWQAFCSNSCSQNSDCPQNTDDPDRVNPSSSNWCYGFGDGTNKCLKLVAIDKSSNQPAQTTTGRNPTTGSNSGNGNNTTGTITSAAQQQACTAATTTAYFDAKVANRVTRYMAILKGIPGFCVQADLGLEPALKDIAAKTVEGDPAGAKGRLLLCSGTTKADGGKPDLVWRVALDTDPGKLREVASENGLPDKRNLPNFKQALDKSGITKPADL